MFPVSARYLESVRKGGAKITKVTHRNLITGTVTTLKVLDGSITEDANAKIRRNLSFTTSATQRGQAGQPDLDLFELLDTPGGEITVTKARKYADGKLEVVPMGVYIADQAEVEYAGGGTLSLTCPDRSLKIQRNRFGLSRASVPGNAAWQEIQRLVEAPWGASFPGWAQLDTSATEKVGSVVYDDGDREGAIGRLCADNSLEFYFDRTGLAVLRPIPVLTPTSAAVWRIDADNDNAVFVTGRRTRDMSRTRNVIIVSTSATDVVFAPVEVKNTTSGDPLNVTGPLGYVPLEYSSPTLRNSTQATAAGRTKLYQQMGEAKTLTLTAFCNDALDAGDVIRAALPRLSPRSVRPVELHIADVITTPLVLGTQDFQTRSTRPDTDGS